MAASRLALFRPSLDAVVGGAVALGCSWTLYDGYADGMAPLQGQVRASPSPPPQSGSPKQRRLHLTPELCRQLEREGYIVVDHFLTREEINAALASIDAAASRFSKGPTAPDDDGVIRTDHHFFFRGGSAKTDDNALPQQQERDHGLCAVQKALDGIGRTILNSTFRGFFLTESDGDDFVGKWLGVPAMMQVSRFDKPGAGGTDGDYFDAHIDAVGTSLMSMGILGYFRSLYTRRRYITCIVYLNPDWKPGDGGCLRMFDRCGMDSVDIEPRGGRLVLFSSVHMMHAVMPAQSKRLACSAWLTLNGE